MLFILVSFQQILFLCGIVTVLTFENGILCFVASFDMTCKVSFVGRNIVTFIAWKLDPRVFICYVSLERIFLLGDELTVIAFIRNT